ncbi:WD40 repeat domain-containing protein [Kitasatospora sp. P5_F3]
MAPFTARDGFSTAAGIQLLGAELDGRPVVVALSSARGRDFAAFDAEDGTQVREFALGAGFIGGRLRGAHIDAGDGRRVLVAVDDFQGLRGTLVQFDPATGERVCPDIWGKRRKPWGRKWPQMSAVVTHRGTDERRSLLLGWSDGRVDRVDPVTGEATGPRMSGTGRTTVRSLAAFAAADGMPRLVGVDADGMLRVWDLETGQLVGGPVKAHNGPIKYVVPYTADGRTRVATGGTDHAVRIWDAESWTPLGEMMVQRDNTLGLCAYQVDGRAVLAAASDRLYRYDGLTGQPVGEPVDGWDEYCEAVCAVEVGGRVALFGADESGMRRLDGGTGEEWPAGAE